MKQHKGIIECDSPDCLFMSKSHSELQLHKITAHSIWQFNCQLCGKGFEKSKNLPIHMKHHETGEPGIIKCTVGKCKQTFTTGTELKKHMDSHSKSSLEPLDYSFLDPQTLDDPQRKVNECPLCGKIIKDRVLLQVHVVRHQTETSGILKCTYKRCQQTCTSASELKDHAAKHWDTSLCPFACLFPGCNFATTTKTRLVIHKRALHSPALWKCHVCGKIYKNKCYVMRHIKSVHTKQQSVDNSKSSGQEIKIAEEHQELVCKDEIEEVVFD